MRLRLTPSSGCVASHSSDAINVNEPPTELLAPSRRPVVLSGSTTEPHEVLRRILGYRVERGATETLMAVTATIR